MELILLEIYYFMEVNPFLLTIHKLICFTNLKVLLNKEIAIQYQNNIWHKFI